MDILDKVHHELISQNLTLATAESCTGGMLASKITSVPEASRYYKGSIIAYSNEIKEILLHVPKQILQKHGAVSKQVAEIMAENLLKVMQVDCSVAITGIAGPAGGTPEKPVGTVYICVANKNKKISRLFNHPKDRISIQEYSTRQSLIMLDLLLNDQR